jgi:hypothetical protein
MTTKTNLNKGIIFMKSLVISLGVILLVLIAVLFILKFNRDKTLAQANKCDNDLIIEVDNEIEKMELQGTNIVVLTKFNQKLGTQQIIKFDSACGKIISKTTFQKANEKDQ